MDLYIDLLRYNGQGEVDEAEAAILSRQEAEAYSLDDTMVSLSSYGPSYALTGEHSVGMASSIDLGRAGSDVGSASSPTSRRLIETIDDLSLGERSMDSISTRSTAIPAATKKLIRHTVRDITKETEYEYMKPEYLPPKKKLVAQLWQRYVSAPFHKWKKRQAMDRRHPVLRYYEQRVVRYEAQRIADISAEMEMHARYSMYLCVYVFMYSLPVLLYD